MDEDQSLESDEASEWPLLCRFYGKGKEQWVPLKTELFEVAKARLREHVGELKEETATSDALVAGRMTFGEAAAIFLERLKSSGLELQGSSGLELQGKRSNRKRVTESTIRYRETNDQGAS